MSLSSAPAGSRPNVGVAAPEPPSASSDAPQAFTTRYDWTTAEIEALLRLPLMDLLWQAQTVHRAANPGYRVQLASLLSVRTGGCEEDCAYCPQSVSYTHLTLPTKA